MTSPIRMLRSQQKKGRGLREQWQIKVREVAAVRLVAGDEDWIFGRNDFSSAYKINLHVVIINCYMT